ncbi:hypothetical protein BGZ80_006486 [Entomortierella chlamydospora]|uniref:tRNA(Ile)-lysidine synthetase n=1 Tax=Entomortierella chlamydospora TaxID=101097 RepID=A0A9P6N500_9FUNG|nr:hypothetical protein BGZ80_006486 [Entomortierella chlamydospora]
MALATLLARHYQSQKINDRTVSLHALIVDHKLRDNSTEEAAVVAAQVQKLNVIPHVLTLDWTTTRGNDSNDENPRHGSDTIFQKPDKTHLETKARLERYKVIAKQCHSLQIKDLYVGHHSGDQVETVVFRFSRASGIDGLAGIQGVAPLSVLNVVEGLNIRVARPLLNVSKERLRATCEDAGTLWVEDPSNQSLDYQRNVIRHYQHDVDVAAENDAQSKLYPLSTAAMLKFRERINQHRQFAWEQVKPWLKDIHFDTENGVCHIKLQTTESATASGNIEWLRESQNHVASRLLSFLVRWVNCKDHAPRLDDIQILLRRLRHPVVTTTTPSSTNNGLATVERENSSISTVYRRKKTRVSKYKSSQQLTEALLQDKDNLDVKAQQQQPIHVAGVLFSPPRKTKGISNHWTISRQPMSYAEQMSATVSVPAIFQDVLENKNEIDGQNRITDLLWDQRYFIRIDGYSLLDWNRRAQVQRRICIRPLAPSDIAGIRQTLDKVGGPEEDLKKLNRWMEDIPGNSRFTIPVVYCVDEQQSPTMLLSQNKSADSSKSPVSETLLSLPTLGIHRESPQLKVISWFKSRDINVNLDLRSRTDDALFESITH